MVAAAAFVFVAYLLWALVARPGCAFLPAAAPWALVAGERSALAVRVVCARSPPALAGLAGLLVLVTGPERSPRVTTMRARF